jgi:hypothetical protein
LSLCCRSPLWNETLNRRLPTPLAPTPTEYVLKMELNYPGASKTTYMRQFEPDWKMPLRLHHPHIIQVRHHYTGDTEPLISNLPIEVGLASRTIFVVFEAMQMSLSKTAMAVSTT